MARARRFETGGAAPVEDLVVGKTEPAMRMIDAQELERVRREIDDDETAAGRQNAARLLDDPCRPIGVMQHLMDDDGVEGRTGEWQLIHVALADRAIAQPGALEIDSRD